VGSHVEQGADSWRKLVQLIGACEGGMKRGKGGRKEKEGGSKG